MKFGKKNKNVGNEMNLIKSSGMNKKRCVEADPSKHKH